MFFRFSIEFVLNVLEIRNIFVVEVKNTPLPEISSCSLIYACNEDMLGFGCKFRNMAIIMIVAQNILQRH